MLLTLVVVGLRFLLSHFISNYNYFPIGAILTMKTVQA